MYSVNFMSVNVMLHCILFVKLCEFHGFFGPKYKNYESRVNRLYGYKPANMIKMYIFKGNFLEYLDLTLG